ncbi:hypothetical protein SUGI_0673980 [Cryptomeria japonica]|nr:hypothetical protein SUGI_0673980 [Cryptomeria japonica]
MVDDNNYTSYAGITTLISSSKFKMALAGLSATFSFLKAIINLKEQLNLIFAKSLFGRAVVQSVFGPRKFNEHLDVAKQFLEEMTSTHFDFFSIDHWVHSYMPDYLLLKEKCDVGKWQRSMRRQYGGYHRTCRLYEIR